MCVWNSTSKACGPNFSRDRFDRNDVRRVPNHAVFSRLARGATAVRRLENFSARQLATWISIVIIYIVRFLFSHRFTLFTFYIFTVMRELSFSHGRMVL